MHHDDALRQLSHIAHERAFGPDLIWADVAYDLDRPEDLQQLVSCALNLASWHESWGVSVQELKKGGDRGGRTVPGKSAAGEGRFPD